MPTDDTSTQGSDAQAAHQTQPDPQNAQAPSESNSFDARKAFDATNKRVNEINEKLSSFDPTMIAKIAEKMGISTEQAEEKVQNESPDVQTIARDVAKSELWNDRNAERIADANKDGKFDQYIEQGLNREHALRLAEQDMGIQVDTSAQKRQQKNSAAEAQVDRSGPVAGQFKAGHGVTDDDIAKYGEQAAGVKVFR